MGLSLGGIGDVFKSASDALFGDPNQSLNAQQKANNQSREYTKEMADQARRDAAALYGTSNQSLANGYQGAIDALGGTLKEQITDLSQGNYYAQQALLAGMPQFQNAILGNTVDNSALQAKLLRPNQRLGWLYDQLLGARSGGRSPTEGRSDSEIQALQDLKAAGLSNEQIRQLALSGMLGLTEQ